MTLTRQQKENRLLQIAKERLALHPNAYARFVCRTVTIGNDLALNGYQMTAWAAMDPARELHEYDRTATAFIDQWAVENIELPTPRIAPIHAHINQASVTEKPDKNPSPKETTEQRQKRRYEACIKAGLEIDSKNTYAYLPRGVGKLAKAEGISTAAFTKDVKLHIERMKYG